MNLQYIRTFSGISKICLAIFGTGVLVIGLLSHYESDWRRIYNNPYVSKWREDGYDIPHRSIEDYYVAMIYFSFILSLVCTVGSFMIDVSKGRTKLMDFVYHILIAVLLLVAGGLYIASAKGLEKYENKFRWEDKSEMKLIWGQKIIAGSLTIIQAASYVVVAFFVWMEL